MALAWDPPCPPDVMLTRRLPPHPNAILHATLLSELHPDASAPLLPTRASTLSSPWPSPCPDIVTIPYDPRCHWPLMPSPSSQSGFENSSPLSMNPSSSPPLSPSLTRFPSRHVILASCTPPRLSLPTLTPHTASTPLMLLRSPRHARSPEPSVSPMRSESGILHYVLALCLFRPHHTTLLGSSSHSAAQQ